MDRSLEDPGLYHQLTDGVGPGNFSIQSPTSSLGSGSLASTDVDDDHYREHGVRLEPGCDDGLCPKCDPGGDPPELQTNVMVSYFLALTAGPSLTSLVFSLSVEYFVEDIGMNVLIDCGVITATAVMAGLLFYAASKLWLSPRATLLGCLVSKTVFTLAIPGAVVITGSIGSPLLYTCMGINGFCTGLVQSQVAAVCGLLPGTKADSLAHIGSFLSAVGTTVVQGVLITLPLVGVALDAKTRMLILFPVAALVTAYGVVAQGKVLGMPTYVRLAAKEEVRLQNLDKSKTKRKIISRLGKIWLYIIGESITWFVGLFISSITPYLMIPGATGFLATSYSTLLLMAFNIFNFLGSLVGKWWASAKVGCPVRTRAALPLRLRSTCRFLFVVGRLGFCFIYVVYAGQCGWGSTTTTGSLFVFGTFVVASLSNGFFTVTLSASCQTTCGFNGEYLCPIVGALVWQFMQLGCVVAYAVSVAITPLLEPQGCAWTA